MFELLEKPITENEFDVADASEEINTLINLFKPLETLNEIYHIQDVLIETEDTKGNLKRQLQLLRELAFVFDRLALKRQNDFTHPKPQR